MTLSVLSQQYRDISPVTLQVGGGELTSSLYCGSVDGLSAGADLVEAFLVEVYRCRLCRFTCGLKSRINSHLLESHAPGPESHGSRLEPTGSPEAGGGGGSPYELEAKRGEEDEDSMERMPFLLHMYDMLSPRCDDSRAATPTSLQVAHTCEVSTLFEDEEEESVIFPLKGDSLDLSCDITPPATQEELAQSAHLMTLGLCRITAPKPPAPAPPPSHRATPDSPPTASAQPKRSGGGLPCLLCPLTFPSGRLLHTHVRAHRPEGGFSCPRCGWTADGWQEVELHWRSHCRKRRRRREQLQQEEEKEKKKKKKKKKNVAFRSVCQLKQEGCVQRRHGDHTGQTVFCSVSNKRTTTPTSRLLSSDGQPPHAAPHSKTSRAGGAVRPSRGIATKKNRGRKEAEEEEKDMESREKTGLCCLLCQRKFSTKLTLRRHMGIHQGEKPYDCPHCQYSTRLKASLVQHIRIHTGEKPYRCPQCPYASIDRSSLRRHSRTHTQEKPYHCQYCSYSSIQKKSLDLHARRHHTGEAFPCQLCQYSSPDRQLLLRHVRKHHASSQHATGHQQRPIEAPERSSITI